MRDGEGGGQGRKQKGAKGGVRGQEGAGACTVSFVGYSKAA